MTATDELLAGNARFAGPYTGGLPAAPSLHVAIVTCMDARIDVYRMLGLGDGAAHVLRNAGGVVTDDVVRSLAVSQRKLGTREIVLVHHTGCGMTTFTDDDFRAELERDTGVAPAWPAETFPDTEEDVRRSMARLRATPFLAHTEAIRGFVVDLDSGTLSEVR